MTKIQDAARIIRNGRVTTPKALIAAVVTTCAASTCEERVTKDGNFCSMTCALTPAPVQTPVQEPVLTPVEAFFQACERADWFYNFSDDSAMWKRGKAQIESLEAQAKADPTLQPIYDAWTAYVASSINGPGLTLPTLDQFTNPTPKEAPVTDHVAPCKDMLNGCIDLECQVRKGIREHLLLNVAEKDRAAWSKATLTVLERLLADSQYGHESPEFFLEASLEGAASIVGQDKEPRVQVTHYFEGERRDLQPGDVAACGFVATTVIPDAAAPGVTLTKCQDCVRVRTSVPTHVQAPKAVLTTTTKAVRKPRTAKIQPRITDNKEHPVTEKITMTKAEMERAIKAAAERLVQERVQEILATKGVPAEDKPVEIVKAKGGRKKVERATAKDREYAGTVLPAIVISEALTIPALEVGEESVDTLVSGAVRSPYNKARFRLDKTPVALDKDTTTYRTLIAEHLRLTALAATPKAAKPAKEAKKIAVAVDTERLAKVAALVTTLGLSRDEAEALVK